MRYIKFDKGLTIQYLLASTVFLIEFDQSWVSISLSKLRLCKLPMLVRIYPKLPLLTLILALVVAGYV